MLNTEEATKAKVEKQLEGFPEVHWATVPWSLVDEVEGSVDTTELATAIRPFFSAYPVSKYKRHI